MTPRIKIVVDSSADLLALSQIPFSSVPLRIVAEGREYIDDARLNVEQMGNELCTYSGSTSVFCPSAGDWVDAFEDADFVFCVTNSITNGTDAVNLAKKLYETLHHEPKLVAVQIGLHPLVTLISMFVGLQLMGIWGMFLLPVLLSVIMQFQKDGVFTNCEKGSSLDNN